MRRLSGDDTNLPGQDPAPRADFCFATDRPPGQRIRPIVVTDAALMESGAGSAADEALSRCAAGELSPELTLRRLLARAQSEEQTEAVLGTAIWNALENRDGARAERLAQVQTLWNRLRRPLHTALHSL